MLLILALLLILGVIAYAIWVRPFLRSRPSLTQFWTEEDQFFAALRLKVAGLKGRIVTVVVAVAGVAVEMNDMLAPLVAQSGVDATKLLPMIPPEAWPVVTIALMLVLQWFRKLGSKRVADAAADNTLGAKV